MKIAGTRKDETKNKGAPTSSLAKRLGVFSKSYTISPIIVAVGILLAALFPYSLGPRNQNVLNQYTIYFVWIVLAESWNLIGGYGGLINLGLVSFFALGCVITSLCLTIGISLIGAMVISGLGGVLFALVLIPTFRLRSDYFAIATLVIPIALKPLVEFVKGKSSFDVPFSVVFDPTQFYFVGLGMTALTIFGIWFLMRSRVGLALRGIGDDEYAAETVGVNVLLFKTVALLASGFVASVAGSYYLALIGAVNSQIFQNLTFSLFPIFMVIIGGLATFEGPIVGALLFSGISYGVVSYFQGSTLEVLIFSVIIMVVAVFLPKGIVPTLLKLGKRLRKKGGKSEEPVPMT